MSEDVGPVWVDIITKLHWLVRNPAKQQECLQSRKAGMESFLFFKNRVLP
jgi:SMC interacting uncharacterized protein involved in chromosome segregation